MRCVYIMHDTLSVCPSLSNRSGWPNIAELKACQSHKYLQELLFYDTHSQTVMVIVAKPHYACSNMLDRGCQSSCACACEIATCNMLHFCEISICNIRQWTMFLQRYVMDSTVRFAVPIDNVIISGNVKRTLLGMWIELSILEDRIGRCNRTCGNFHLFSKYRSGATNAQWKRVM